MAWGTLGAEETLEGASSRSWTLRFERRLAPREGSVSANDASSVWLVRDVASARLYAAKRQSLASLGEVDALVDEAAAWRAACLADHDGIIPELVDVFVARSAPFSVTFLADFCARGLLPRSPPLSEAVLLTLAADLAGAADALPSPHGHIEYESLLVDEKGCVRLAGFGAHRSAILRDNAGLNKQDDAFDIGLLLYELVFGSQPPESLEVPESDAYSSRVTDIIVRALGHALPGELKAMALAAGAEPRAPVVDVERRSEPEKALPVHVSRAAERNVDRLAAGTDIATAFSALVSTLKEQPEAVASAIFKALFVKPVSKDPVCAMRVLTMIHNLLLDGPDTMLAAVRKNDKFMDWTESSWTSEAIESNKREDAHEATSCFAGGELAFYSSLLRRKARFHMLAAGAFLGNWNRTNAVAADGSDLLATRRRKVVNGMADLVEMCSELGCRLAAATDHEAAVKQAALGAMVSECCLAYTAALVIAEETPSVRGVEKLASGIGRMYVAARALVFAVEHTPAAGGEQWVEQFSSESPPDVVAEAHLREQNGVDGAADIPLDGWDQTENIVVDEEKAQRKKAREEIRRRRREKAEAKAQEKEEQERKEALSAADGALVLHGAGDEAAARVSTMFGDLLSMDDSRRDEETGPAPAPRPLPNMSNSQALASAFGVPEEAVGGQNLALPPPEGFDDDDGESGGYDDYRARQEEVHSRQRPEHQVGSTAAWAARSGYARGALVVSGGAVARKKSHPAFCQCALCEREEEQAGAQEPQAVGRERREVNNGKADQAEQQRRLYYDDGQQSAGAGVYDEPRADDYSYNRRDSLDDDDDDDGYNGLDDNVTNRRERNGNAGRDSYYRDAYDSYESVSYSIDDESRLPQANATPMPLAPPAPSSASLFLPDGAPQYRPSFALDPKFVINMKKLRMGEKVSDSGSMAVYKGEYNRETVAIKKMTKNAMNVREAVDDFKNEVEIMFTLSHPALMPCIAASMQKPNYILVTEFMKRGTLFDVLHKSRIKLTWALIRKIAIQLAEGMEHMHEQALLHRDLKSLNIFVDGSYNVKIGDFGLSRHISSPREDGIAGTMQYMAPEVLMGEPHSTKSDVFSYAHVLCEVISGTPPFQGMDSREVGERVVRDDIRPPIPPHCQRAYVNLIQMCWASAPSTRPSFAQIVDMINKTTK